MKIFDWIKHTPKDERNIAQLFVMYACSWGLFFATLCGFCGIFGALIYFLVKGINVTDVLRLIVASAVCAFGMLFGCSTITYFKLD